MTAYLVTGASGFLGRYVVAELRARNHSVALLASDLTRSPLSLPDSRVDVLIHLAGLAHVVPRTVAEAEQFYRVNADGTRALVEALVREKRVPRAIVLASTVAVYGVERGESLPESTPTRATDSYGESKRFAEAIVADFANDHGLRAAILRLPLLAGSQAPGNLGAMVRWMRKRVYAGISDGSARRSMVRAADVAAIIPTAAEVGGTFHLTDGEHPSYFELEAAIASAMHRPPPPRLPLPLAKLVAHGGDLIERMAHRRPPFDSRALKKMTSTLTFSDELARRNLDWRPTSVLSNAGELVA